MEDDVRGMLEAKLPLAQEMARSGRLAEAVETLLVVEKYARLAGDIPVTSDTVQTILDLCYAAGDWKTLQECLIVCAKRKGQLKQVVTKMTQFAMGLLDQTPSMEVKINLITTLRTVTAGKIYVELERARLTRTLSQIKEAEGNLREAADILQEVQVETYGSMERPEKADFILEQVRLCVETNDFVHAYIISKKVNTRTLNEPSYEALKERYYSLMIQYYTHGREYLDIARAYYAIYELSSVREDPEKLISVLRNIAIFLCLAPHDNEQSDMLHRFLEEKNLEKVESYRALLQYFSSTELVRWPRVELIHKEELSTHEAFQGQEGERRWDDLKNRIVEHNIRVVAEYYSQITLVRLAELLDLSVEDTEKRVSEMVVAQQVFARIDRPAGVLSFRKPLEASEVLNMWSQDVSSVMGLVEQTCHLIQKERMTHKV